MSQNFNKNELMVISKYILPTDYQTFFKTFPNINTYYHSTFNYITIPAYFKLPIFQIKKIIENLKLSFPNVEEIILNIRGHVHISKFNIILINYNNFKQLSNLKVNIKFNGSFMIDLMNDDINIITKISKFFNSTINIYITNYYNYSHVEELNFNLRNIKYIIYLQDIGLSNIENTDKNILNKLYFSYVNKCESMIFKYGLFKMDEIKSKYNALKLIDKLNYELNLKSCYEILKLKNDILKSNVLNNHNNSKIKFKINSSIALPSKFRTIKNFYNEFLNYKYTNDIKENLDLYKIYCINFNNKIYNIDINKKIYKNNNFELYKSFIHDEIYLIVNKLYQFDIDMLMEDIKAYGEIKYMYNV